MPYTPQPLPLSFIVFLFNMPNLPNGPSVNAPSVNAPNFSGPSFSPPTVGSSGIGSPTFSGPNYQGPTFNSGSYSGPNMPGGGSSGRAIVLAPAAQPKNHAGFWLGVLIVLWTLAFISLIVLIMYLAGVNFNIFNYQRYKLQDVERAFTNAGLEVTRPTTFTSSSNFNNPSINFTFIEGESFIIPSATPSGAGGILIFSSSGQLNQAKEVLADRTRNGNIPYFVYFRDNVVVFINAPDAIARRYEAALNTIR